MMARGRLGREAFEIIDKDPIERYVHVREYIHQLFPEFFSNDSSTHLLVQHK